MKVTVIPAQVTTVEDRIIGNLSMVQVLLLSGPLFLGALSYGVLPPFMEGAIYKYILALVLLTFFGVLSIRLKGVVLVSRLLVLARYYLRPRVYLFTKNTTVLKNHSGRPGRGQMLEPGHVEGAGLGLLDPGSEISELLSKREVDRRKSLAVAKTGNSPSDSKLSVDEIVRIRTDIETGLSEVSFKTDKKGRLYVRVAKAE